MSDYTIPPFVDTSWRNDSQAANDAALILRLPAGSVDGQWLLQCAGAAGDAICLELDRLDPIPGIIPGFPPNALRNAHARATVNEFRSKDAPNGVVNSWAPDDAAEIVAGDCLVGVRPLIRPYKARWGCA